MHFFTECKTFHHHRHHLNKVLIVIFLLPMVVACATVPPKQQENICRIFDVYPKWFDYAHQSQKEWGTPKHILMAFVKQESSFRSHAKPPFKWFLFVPVGRGSSAKGYAQAQNPVWREYESERGALFRNRTDMEDALDFIGWYNHRTHTRLGISKWNAKELYLAYHEGHGGYKRGNHNKKPRLLSVSDKVARVAGNYAVQLPACEKRLRCRSWYKVWPLCR